MALTKVRDGGTKFTGAISSMKLLLNATISSAVAVYDISSASYINSTYDSYHLIASLRPASTWCKTYMVDFL